DNIKNIDYGVYLYEDKTFNAFSAKKDNGYVIAFSTTCLQKILKNAEEMFANKEVLQLFNLEQDDIKLIHYYKSAIIDYMSWFIALHEFYHILPGHCGKSSITEDFNIEFYKTKTEKENYYSQILEMDADCSAVSSLTLDILITAIKTNTFPKNTEESISSEQEEKIYDFCREIMFLSFSVYDLFLLFSADKKIDVKKAIENLLIYDHPLPSIRMVYTLPWIIYEVSRVLSDNDQKTLVNNISNICIAYDRIFYAKGDFSQSLQAIGNTREAAELRIDLNNGWNDIIPLLKDNAIIELHPREIMTELIYWVDDKGKMLKTN
ncbi:MAG: hypothetical protein J6Z11_03485, partial [Candidatus Riflebacteria bacterium]|nr:hypothetical protein [Candidatus Riflebacteria bacterium]